MEKNQYKDGNKHGYWESYSYGGHILNRGHYDDDGNRIGYWEGFHENGNMAYCGSYVRGQRIGGEGGYWVSYLRDGSIRNEYFYIN